VIRVASRPRACGRVASALAALALSSLLPTAGCGTSEPGLTPVRGKVTLDGGPWPREGTIYFTPSGTTEGADPSKSRPGSAKFGADGSFTAGSFEARDGLFPGTYKVSVDCAEAGPQMSPTGKLIEAGNAVPKSYRDASTSGLTLTVKPGERADATFDVRTK
jgi:hypothetical protein